MPSHTNFLFRWIGLFSGKLRRENTGFSENSIVQNNGGESSSSNSDETPVLSSGECYACTQVGVPAFHSTSCDQANAPEWRASAGSSLVPIQEGSAPTDPARTRVRRLKGPFGEVLDPRSKRVQRWNRALLLARGMALAVDPLFFYALSIGRTTGPACLYMDGAFAAVVTVVRTCLDALHLWHVWLQFRLAYVSRELSSPGTGTGTGNWDGSGDGKRQT